MIINGIELELFTWQYFKKQLRLQGRTYKWLAENMGYGYPHTYRLLNGIDPLNENHKQILIELLEIPIVSKVTEKTIDQTT